MEATARASRGMLGVITVIDESSILQAGHGNQAQCLRGLRGSRPKPRLPWQRGPAPRDKGLCLCVLARLRLSWNGSVIRLDAAVCLRTPGLCAHAYGSVHVKVM